MAEMNSKDSNKGSKSSNKKNPQKHPEQSVPKTDESKTHASDSRDTANETNIEIGDMLPNSDSINKVSGELVKLYDEKQSLLSLLESDKALLKPIRKPAKVIPILLTGSKPSRSERKIIKVRIESTKRQVLNLNTLIEEKEARLGALSKSSVKDIKRSSLYDKAHSSPYIKKNGHYIWNKVLKTINDLISEPDTRASIIKLRIIAKDNSSEGNLLFEETFSDILKEHNEAAYILTSGNLKEKVYDSVRETLKKWDPKKESQIEDLI